MFPWTERANLIVHVCVHTQCCACVCKQLRMCVGFLSCHTGVHWKQTNVWISLKFIMFRGATTSTELMHDIHQWKIFLTYFLFITFMVGGILLLLQLLPPCQWVILFSIFCCAWLLGLQSNWATRLQLFKSVFKNRSEWKVVLALVVVVRELYLLRE